VYVFGEHELDVDGLELRHAGCRVPLEPQTFDVLTYLVRHHTRVVPKEELMDELWGGRFVSETAVTSRIKQARRALGDDGQAQGFIRTYHGRGYRFVADVQETSAPAPVTARGDGDRILVLPTLQAEGPAGLAIPYHLAGQGPPDLVLVGGPRNALDEDWGAPERGGLLRGLAAMGRLIRYDERDVDLETGLGDLITVLDSAACEHAVLVSEGDGGPLAILAASRYGDRFPALVLWATYAERAEPAADVSPLLASLRQRTLVIHRTGDPVVPVQSGRRLAALVPDAELVELPGDAHAAEADAEQVLDALSEFVEAAAAAEAPHQTLTALVGLAGGDTESLVSVLVGLGGRIRRGPEHALVVSFDGPAAAIRALRSRRARGFLAGVGIGIAIDEVSREAVLVSGHGVDVARLLARRAAPGEVLVPTVIKDLLAGSGLHVESAGSFDLPHVGPHPAYRWLR
jgi:DNA-binding winged helix-turn-helix (wHTH) protein/pimeloyl-ACP methyl ester carboxylesterase